MNSAVQSPNAALASLDAPDFENLRPHLRMLELEHQAVLFRDGDPITRIYFPHSGVVSLMVGLSGGETIEVAMIGRDSVVGAASALDGKVAVNMAVVQVPGIASVVDVGHFRDAATRSAGLRTLVFRHEEALLAQAEQSSACVAFHTVEARMSRWLLRVRDLTGTDEFSLTQEFLGEILGVRRVSISIVANTLQEAGFIRYSRGHIAITNLDGLRRNSCECYAVVKKYYDRLASNE